MFYYLRYGLTLYGKFSAQKKTIFTINKDKTIKIRKNRSNQNFGL